MTWTYSRKKILLRLDAFESGQQAFSFQYTEGILYSKMQKQVEQTVT